MNWQEELRRLDEELAAGRLAAEEYRLRRDELLAQAASGPRSGSGAPPAGPGTPPGGTPAGPGTPPGGTPAGPGTGTPGGGPGTGAPAAGETPSPFPAPFRWEPTPEPVDATQVMSAIRPDGAGEDSGERTQVVRREGVPADGERTQVVPGSGPLATPAPGQRPPQQQPGGQPPFGANPPWGGYQGGGSSAPPWVGSDLPPDPSPMWLRQGPEDFTVTKEPNRGARLAGLVIVAVLAVGLVAAGVVYVIQRGDGTTAAPPGQSSTAPPTTTTSELPEPPPALPRPVDTAAALIDPPGEVRGGGGPLDLAKLQDAQLFSQATLQVLTAGNMTDGILKTTTLNGSTIGLYALTVSGPEAAQEAVDVIGQGNATGGVRPDATREQKGVKVYATAESAQDHVFRALYVLYDRAIEVEVFGPDRAAVQTLFDDLLEQQLQHAPPSER